MSNHLAGKTVRNQASAHAQDNTQVESLQQILPSQLQNPQVEDLEKRAAEMLFNMQGSYAARPDSFPNGYSNFKNNTLQQYGAPPLVAESLAALQSNRNSQKCNIYLSGGTTKLPGLADRLEQELGQMLPSSCAVTVHQGEHREHAGWRAAWPS